MSYLIALLCAGAAAMLCYVGLLEADLTKALIYGAIPLAAGLGALIQRLWDSRRARQLLGPVAMEAMLTCEGECARVLVVPLVGELLVKDLASDTWRFLPEEVESPSEGTCELNLPNAELTFRTSAEADIVYKTLRLPKRCKTSSDTAQKLLLEQL